MRTGRGEFLHKTFEDMARVDQHSATDLVLIQVASFLRRELPIRLAHRIHDLEAAPVMRDMGSVQDVKELYITSMMELVEFDEKITTPEQEEAFSALVERIYERHGSVLVRKSCGDSLFGWFNIGVPHTPIICLFEFSCSQKWPEVPTNFVTIWPWVAAIRETYLPGWRRHIIF